MYVGNDGRVIGECGIFILGYFCCFWVGIIKFYFMLIFFFYLIIIYYLFIGCIFIVDI